MTTHSPHSTEDPTATPTMAEAEAEVEVVAVESLRCALLNSGDLAALAALLDDAYLHVHGTGRVTDKPTTLARLGTQPRHCERGTLTVRVWGDAALIVGEQVNRTRLADGTEQKSRGMVTQTLRRHDDRWTFLSLHFTALAA